MLDTEVHQGFLFTKGVKGCR